MTEASEQVPYLDARLRELEEVELVAATLARSDRRRAGLQLALSCHPDDGVLVELLAKEDWLFRHLLDRLGRLTLGDSFATSSSASGTTMNPEDDVAGPGGEQDASGPEPRAEPVGEQEASRPSPRAEPGPRAPFLSGSEPGLEPQFERSAGSPRAQID